MLPKVLQEAISFLSTHAALFPIALPHQHLSHMSESSIFWYLTHTTSGVWKTNPGQGKQNKKKPWLFSQRAVSIKPGRPPAQVNFILPALMLPFCSLKCFTPSFKALHSSVTLALQHAPPAPNRRPPSQLCIACWLLLYKYLHLQSRPPQLKAPDTTLLRPLLMG